jgi:hypothetical protein
MRFTKICGVLGTFAALSFASGAARANYVCEAVHVPAGTSLGASGYVYATLYSEPNCTGTYWGTRYFCSPTPTMSLCASSANYHHDQAELIALFAGLQRAIIHDTFVTVWSTTCLVSGSTTCGAYVGYEAN